MPQLSRSKRLPITSGLYGTAGRGVLAHLGLARANALQAKISPGADNDAARARALAAYKAFKI